MIRAVFFAAFCGLAVAENICTGPEVRGKVQSSADSLVNQRVAVVVDLELKCKSGDASSFPLYAEINGKTFTAAQNLQNPSKYQISFTEEAKRLPSSYLNIRILDESGYQQVRKGDAAVKELTSLNHSVRLPYSGPSFNSEILVALIGAAVLFVAHTLKNDLTSKP